MFTNLRDITPNKIAAGVEERVLLSSSDTSYGRMSIRVLSLDPGAATSIGGLDQDEICYVLDGKGVANIKWLSGYWKYLLRSEIAVLIPNLEYHVRNCGDSTMRCLLASCHTEPKADDRETSIRTVDLRNPAPNTIANRTYGYEVRIFTGDVLSGRSKFGYCGYGRLYSGGATEMHIPTGECEETMYITSGAGEIATGKDRHPVTTGSLAHVPRNTYHNEKSTSEEPFEYVVFESHD